MRIEEIRSRLAARLRCRAPEIEQAILTRVHAVSDPRQTPDPEYLQGLRAATTAAIVHATAALERSSATRTVPTELLSQARLAARNDVSLDTVLRRYFAGYTVFADFLIEEAEASRMGSRELKRLLRNHSALFDDLVATVSEEYGREGRPAASSAKQRRLENVERLLAGELADHSSLHYDLEGWHLGAVAVGPEVAERVRGALAGVDALTLIVDREENVTWLWLGSRVKPDPETLLSLCGAGESRAIAVGEPASGIEGWRLTHRQALASLPVALRSEDGRARYRQVAILAAALQDDLLATSLRRLYLDPLERERDGGTIARETLRAHIDSRCMVSSTASLLGITRKTVTARLRTIERRIDQSLDSCWMDVDAALRLDEANRRKPTHSA